MGFVSPTQLLVKSQKPCISLDMQGKTGHLLRYAGYQNLCPVMAEREGFEPSLGY